MFLILTHENADFDAVASQLAAYKLFPEGVPLLPRRLNRNVQQFLTLYWDVLPFMRPEDWKRRRVDEVLLVDTQSLTSVRGLVRSPLVRVIDHHEIHKRHQGWQYHVDQVGATTTLLVERLQAAGMTLAPEEATLLLLGVYEDTGTLTYETTTGRDAAAAAWLLEQGALLKVVRQFLSIPLTEAQQRLFRELQATAEWIEEKGQALVVATAVAPDDFDDEISSIAHRLRDVLLPAGLFVLVQLRGDVQLVARSMSEMVDVSVVARALNGGGHSRAAAALVVGRSLEDVRQEVVALLPQAVRPMARVSQIMSYGVQTIPATASVAEAAAKMQRFGHEGYPVVDPETGELVGLLTRRAVDRAMSHDLGRLPVSRVMRAGRVTVRPSDSVERVQQLMLAEGWGQIPVVADSDDGQAGDRPIGVVTRTDVLNYLFQALPETAVPEMRRLLVHSLPPALWQMVVVVGETADSLGMPLYFVGGIVRDLLLGHSPTDLDMVVEGDAIALVQKLQARFGGQIHTHSRFGTAKWFVTPAIWQRIAPTASLENVPATIDFVTARTEFYREPSALPEVSRGSIKLDLHRRDFTINTLAIRLDGVHLGEFLDFYGGRRDLEQGVIRVLHSLSFVDDPTRILRAVRLEQRLGFRIEPRTMELLVSSLPMLDRVTGDRIRHEIELALRESNPVPVMERLWELGVMRQIHPALAWSQETAVAFARVPKLLTDPEWKAALRGESPAFVYFALWILPLTAEEQTAVMDRLRVRKATREDMAAIRRVYAGLCALPPTARRSEVAALLRPYPARVLLAVRAAFGEDKPSDWIEAYYREWQWVKTAVTGDDLRAMGLKPGPLYGRLLNHLLAARLDGEVQTEAEEKELLNKLLAEIDQTNK